MGHRNRSPNTLLDEISKLQPMKTLRLRTSLWFAVLATASWTSAARAQAQPENRPPDVTMLWPDGKDSLRAGTVIRIKASASDPDGTIARVQFFAETNLLGVVTNPPFNVLWQVDVRGATYGTWNLKAVAFDNLGASTESVPVTIYYYTGGPPEPVLEIVSPRNAEVFAAPATFDFAAELLASTGDRGPVEFFVGTNSVGLVDQRGDFTATTPPNSITLSNLLEGEYKLTVRYLGFDGVYCTCVLRTNTVQVVKLGFQSPIVTTDGRLQFEVVTSFPGKPTVIQASENLLDWLPISTNQPSNNIFTFTDSSLATISQRFYRALVPP